MTKPPVSVTRFGSELIEEYEKHFSLYRNRFERVVSNRSELLCRSVQNLVGSDNWIALQTAQRTLDTAPFTHEKFDAAIAHLKSTYGFTVVANTWFPDDNSTTQTVVEKLREGIRNAIDLCERQRKQQVREKKIQYWRAEEEFFRSVLEDTDGETADQD